MKQLSLPGWLMLIGVLTGCWLTGCKKSDTGSYVLAGGGSTVTSTSATTRDTDSVVVSPPAAPRVLLGTDIYYGSTIIFSNIQDRRVAHDSVTISRYTGDSVVMLTSNFQLSSRKLTWVMFGGDTTVKDENYSGEIRLALMVKPQPNTLRLIGAQLTRTSFKELTSFQFSGKKMD